MFITHDLGTVRRIAHRTAVMLKGEVIAQGPTAQIFSPPFHPLHREADLFGAGDGYDLARPDAFWPALSTKPAVVAASHDVNGPVEVVEHLWIALCAMATTARRANVAAGRYLRKRCRRSSNISPIVSATALARRDEPMHGWFAAHGYVAMRVSTCAARASPMATSQTNISQQELDDACEVIDWLSRQNLVQRQRRDDGQVVGRLQRPADRRIAPARRSRRSSRSVRQTIATPTTSTTWAARCSTTISGGARSCCPIRRGPPDPGAGWRCVGARLGSSASNACPSGLTLVASPSAPRRLLGAMARSAKIFRRSLAPCSR